MIYRVAVLHPSMRIPYFAAAGWEQEWIDNAVVIAETCWVTNYKPEANKQIAGPKNLQFAYSKVRLCYELGYTNLQNNIGLPGQDVRLHRSSPGNFALPG